MRVILTALAAGLASGFSSYERKEGCPELYSRGVRLRSEGDLRLLVPRRGRAGGVPPGRDSGLHRVRLAALRQ